MQLSTDTSLFKEKARKAKISNNLDGSEGGLDALMQVIVCKEEIGWRDKARRIIVFSTDEGFHLAGDGKLGGIIKPNDGLCHMKDHEYSASLFQDYPSIGHLNAVVKQNAVNIIFAATMGIKKPPRTEEEMREQRQRIDSVYTSLSEAIKGSSFVRLAENSTDVVEKIREEYHVNDCT